MKKWLLTFAAGIVLFSTLRCKEGEKTEITEKAENGRSSFDYDAKNMADLTCKVFNLMMSGNGVTPEGMPTDEFVKLSSEVESLTKEMEVKYKALEEWDEFEKTTQTLVDKCGQ